MRRDHSTPRGKVTTLTLDSELLRGNLKQQLFFDAELQLRRSAYLRDDALMLAVDYDKIDEEDAFPRRVKIEMPLQQTRVTLNLSEVRLNEPAKAGRFELKPPENVVPLQLLEQMQKENS